MKKNTPSGIRFEQGTKQCGICKSNNNIIQFERDTTKKGLPIIEIAFICESCAETEGLIIHSRAVKQ